MSLFCEAVLGLRSEIRGQGGGRRGAGGMSAALRGVPWRPSELLEQPLLAFAPSSWCFSAPGGDGGPDPSLRTPVLVQPTSRSFFPSGPHALPPS